MPDIMNFTFSVVQYVFVYSKTILGLCLGMQLSYLETDCFGSCFSYLIIRIKGVFILELIIHHYLGKILLYA